MTTPSVTRGSVRRRALKGSITRIMCLTCGRFPPVTETSQASLDAGGSELPHSIPLALDTERIDRLGARSAQDFRFAEE
jgi:hypothetical protein